jgi:hypothetical protein
MRATKASAFALAALFLLCYSYTGTNGTVYGQGAASAKLRVLAIADPAGFDVKNGAKVSGDAYNVQTTFTLQVPEHDLTTKVIADPDTSLTPDTILDAIENMEVDPNDAFVFFYSGHGAFSRSEGYYFDLSGTGNDGATYLLRSRVKEKLLQKGARLTVLISDCCSAEVEVPRTYRYDSEAAAPAVRVMQWSPLCKKLMKETSGFVDFTSSTPPELSWTDKTRIGSIFTLELCGVLDRNSERSLSWKSVFESTKSATVNVARGRQKSQTPILLEYAVTGSGNANGVRFGAEAKALPGGGVLIKQIIPGFAAEIAGLEVGDEIHRWNGRDVTGIEDFSRFVDASSGEVTLTVRNVRDGDWYDIKVVLP